MRRWFAVRIGHCGAVGRSISRVSSHGRGVVENKNAGRTCRRRCGVQNCGVGEHSGIVVANFVGVDGDVQIGLAERFRHVQQRDGQGGQP